jgi:acyl carrier protein
MQGLDAQMNEIQQRLVKCFEYVFPSLPREEIPRSSQANNSAWDSIAAITLANVIEDEFGFQIDLDLLPELNSFDHILSYVKSEVQG